ncbi:MAG TPA: SGNH/GDSL hydrolase family protein [Pyrinomonadaceae bacterium]|jgi:lysophospholipase L1-like esterase|nr:SGNH/GDSL hydrolase family protein [Pyrinomonadaceae bacterium]
MTLRPVKSLFLIIVVVACVQAQQQPATTNKWEAEIRKFEEADRKTPPPKDAVLFVGSSSIRLWSSLDEDFPSVKIINRGFGGSDIEDSTHYVGRIVTPYRPRLIVLYAGDNDLANGKSPEQVSEDFRAFVGRVRRDLPQSRIAFISIKPSPARQHLIEKQKAANGMIKKYISREKGLSYIDVFTPMLGKDGGMRPELFVGDGLHLNKEGYALWKSVAAPHLR